MSNENDKKNGDAKESEAATPSGGERLAEARRAQQVSVTEIAKELHLDEYKVRAIENNEFDVLGAPVFAKGHIRKYAQLVSVDESTVMADYDALAQSVEVPQVISLRKLPRREISPGPWVAAIVALLIAAAAYWWFAVRESSTSVPDVGREALTSMDNNPSLSNDEQIDDVVDENEGVADAEESVTEAPVAEVVAAPVQAAAPAESQVQAQADELRLSLAFSGDCWTEISDAQGRRLFFGLGADGRTVNLTGQAPFNALFGNAANVSLTVNGEPFQIQASDRRGRTARLTISGS